MFVGFDGDRLVQFTEILVTHTLAQLGAGGLTSVDLHSGESVVVDRTPAQFSAITLPQYVVFANNAVVFVDDKTPQTVSLEIMAVPTAKLVDDN